MKTNLEQIKEIAEKGCDNINCTDCTFKAENNPDDFYFNCKKRIAKGALKFIPIYPKMMLVWDDDEAQAIESKVVYVSKSGSVLTICIDDYGEEKREFEMWFRHAKDLPKERIVTKAEIRKALNIDENIEIKIEN